MDTFRLKPSRYPSRSREDKASILTALHESLFCTIAFNRAGIPHALPTGFCFDTEYLYVHGSVKSGFLLDVLENETVCLNIFSAQALVLAHTAFDHSVNYLSVNLFSKAEEVFEEERKREVLEAFTERYIPGRMAELPAITREHLLATRVLRFSLETALLKQRSGGPNVAETQRGEQLWTGLLPLETGFGTPLPDAYSQPLPLPDYLKRDSL